MFCKKTGKVESDKIVCFKFVLKLISYICYQFILYFTAKKENRYYII